MSVKFFAFLQVIQPHPILRGLTIALLLAAVTDITYRQGGTHTVFPQLFYLPIVVGVIFFNLRGGLITGLAAGLLCGPLMPLDVEAGLAQAPERWLLRLGIFMLVGLLTGALASALSQRVYELEEFNGQAVRAFVQTIDAKSPYTARHSERVADFAVAIAHQLGLRADAIERIRWAALLHDIGKLRVPEVILNKPDQLTPEEWAVMQGHPIESARMLEGVHTFQPYLSAIRHHHERPDGRGYPDGLTGEAIPVEARILAVADAFEAMTAERPYRPAMLIPKALQQLEAGAGTQFDPRIVHAFIQAQTHHDLAGVCGSCARSTDTLVAQPRTATTSQAMQSPRGAVANAGISSRTVTAGTSMSDPLP